VTVTAGARHNSIGLRWQASTLDAEAATWQLLWHLYGVTEREFPAGLGGPALDDVGGLCTAAQRIADAVAQFDDLNRCVGLEGHMQPVWHRKSCVLRTHLRLCVFFASAVMIDCV